MLSWYTKQFYLAFWAAVIAWVGARAPILSSAARWVAATPVFTDRTGTQPLQHHNHSLQAEHKSKTSQTSRQKLHNKK